MGSSIKILFVGGLFLSDDDKRITTFSKGAVQNAANKLQWNYVKGIESNISTSIDILNAIYIGTFPKYYSKLFVKGNGNYCDSNSRNIYDIGFVNFPLVSDHTKYFKMKKVIRKWIKNNEGSDLYIIAYGFFEHNIRALAYAKHFKGVTTCLIVPDLPQYMSLNGKISGIRFVIRYVILRHIYHVYDNLKKYIDYYSLITDQMGSYLGISPNRYVVIDGMTEEEKYSSESVEIINPEDKFSFLYTGGLSASYGTDALITSFTELDNPNVELWICGDGPYTDDIINRSKIDKRIKYFGILPQNECIELQRKASCLINSREDSDITEYSFPSKTMEYLMSGKPVIAKKLAGMSEEYADLFFQFDNYEKLSTVMEKVSKMSKEQLQRTGERGRLFVATKKNNKYQTLKMLNMLGMN